MLRSILIAALAAAPNTADARLLTYECTYSRDRPISVYVEVDTTAEAARLIGLVVDTNESTSPPIAKITKEAVVITWTWHDTFQQQTPPPKPERQRLQINRQNGFAIYDHGQKSQPLFCSTYEPLTPPPPQKPLTTPKG